MKLLRKIDALSLEIVNIYLAYSNATFHKIGFEFQEMKYSRRLLSYENELSAHRIRIS